MKSDQKFEEFCRALPGVLRVTLPTLAGSYRIVVQHTDFNPINRAVTRWMTEHGCSYELAWAFEPPVAPSQYDPLDRAISSLGYQPNPLKT